MLKTLCLFGLCLAFTACDSGSSALVKMAKIDSLGKIDTSTFSDSEMLGFKIFSDTRLSSPEGLACMSCHNPKSAFTDSRKDLPVSQGAFATHFGNRNTPTAMYKKFIPPLHLEASGEEGGQEIYVGGLFLDGRVQSLKDQAKVPLLNPIEMGATKESVVKKVCESNDYKSLLQKVYGNMACADEEWSEEQIETTFNLLAQAVEAFESTAVFSPFSSKFDRVMAGQESFTEIEQMGFQVFNDQERGNCAACHSLDRNNAAKRELFTDFTYDNLGLPINPEFSKLGHNNPDFGLSQTTGRRQDRGLFRVPTLRNIAVTAPYGHNGYFQTLEQVVDFYNTRDVKPSCPENLSAGEAEKQHCWPKAEVPETVNNSELGDLNLTLRDQKALIEFLHTLTDGK